MRVAVETDPGSVFMESVSTEACFSYQEQEEKNKNVDNKNSKWSYLTCSSNNHLYY